MLVTWKNLNLVLVNTIKTFKTTNLNLFYGMGSDPVLDVTRVQPIRYNGQDGVGAGAQPAERRGIPLAEHGVEAVHVRVRLIWPDYVTSQRLLQSALRTSVYAIIVAKLNGYLHGWTLLLHICFIKKPALRKLNLLITGSCNLLLFKRRGSALILLLVSLA